MKIQNVTNRPEYDFVITADESCMHNYNMSFIAGFLACLPRDIFPNVVKHFIEAKFFSEAPNKDGKVEIAILALRKIESYLSDFGYNVIVTTPQSAAKMSSKVYLLSTMDPLGYGPATTTMVGLTGGNDPYNRYFFRSLIKQIRQMHTNAKIVVGGPGVWEFNIDETQQKTLGIDCIVNGPIESLGKQFFDDMLLNKIEQKVNTQSYKMRPDPHLIKGPSFWGMVEISRGCGRGCQFCDYELMSGFKWIPKDFILKEVAVNANSEYVNTITLLSEDIFRYGTKIGEWRPNQKIVELIKEISKFGKEIAFTHSTLASALGNPKIVEDVAHYCNLNKKHLSGVQTGIESGSPRMMEKYMIGKVKPWKPEDWCGVVEQGMGVMIDNYIIPHCTLVMGLPEEKGDDVVKTIELVDKLHSYPSLILPLFFVPLSVLKGKFFITDIMTTEHRDLLDKCAEHTAYWSKRLPNWSGQLGILDKLVFRVGADHSFRWLRSLTRGKSLSSIGVLTNMVKEVTKASFDMLMNKQEELDWWDKTDRNYSILEKLSHYEKNSMVKNTSVISDKPQGSGCGCSIGGLANTFIDPSSKA